MALTTPDTELRGGPVAGGTVVTMVLGSATTAERPWDDVATIDLDRGSNAHIPLGGGPQRCPGSLLARVELRATIEDRHAAVPERSLEPKIELQHRRRPRRIENLELVR